MGLVLTSLEPMPHRAFSLPFPGMMSPSLPVWVMPLYRGTQFGAEVEIPFWGIWQVRRVSKSLCAHVCECMCTCVLGHAPVTAGCIIAQGKTLNLPEVFASVEGHTLGSLEGKVLLNKELG